MAQILGKMNREEITIVLKGLAEGLLHPKEWTNWWTQNEALIKPFLSPRWYLKIKPKMSQGITGATLISQNAAREYLNSINVPYRQHSETNYIDQWREEIEAISMSLDCVDSVNFEKKFTALNRCYPNLFISIKKNLQRCDIIESTLTSEILTSSLFHESLHKDVISFFFCVSKLKMEGVFVGFDILEKRGEYIKLGELWLNNDGDELYVKPHESSVYLYDISENNICVISHSFRSFIDFDLSRFISGDL